MPRLVQDLIRIFLLLVVAGLALYLVDPANEVVFQAMGIAVFLIGGTHLTRRVLFHRIDLQKVAQKAVDENNIAAAMVFASICGFLVATMFLSMSVLK